MAGRAYLDVAGMTPDQAAERLAELRDCDHRNTATRHDPPTDNKILGQKIETCDDCGLWRTVSPTGVRGEWQR